MKKYWGNIKVVLMLVILGGLFAFTNSRNEVRKITGTNITFLNDDNLYITYETVNKLLIQNTNGTPNVAKEILDLNRIERALNSNKMIQSAHVYVTVNGQLDVSITQRTPIARVSGTTSYYIDTEGERMPLSSVYAARVPLVTGSVTTQNLKDTYAVSKYINDDSFLKTNVIGIHCANNEFKLQLRSDNFVVVIGDAKELQRKFTNFKAFYQKALKDNSLNNFSKVNLQFGNQVVCTKK
jgi:cell division protein FtsQ